jgi:hypothetical protein
MPRKCFYLTDDSVCACTELGNGNTVTESECATCLESSCCIDGTCKYDNKPCDFDQDRGHCKIWS